MYSSASKTKTEMVECEFNQNELDSFISSEPDSRVVINVNSDLNEEIKSTQIIQC